MSNRLDENRAEARVMTAGRVGGLLFGILMTGCSVLEKVPAGDPLRKDAARGAAVAPVAVAVPDASTGATPPIATTPVTTVAHEPKATRSATPNTVSQPAAQAAAPPAKVIASTTPAGQSAKGPLSAPVKSAASPPLDMKTLEARLKETRAIGVFTKIALKNQVDDLLNQFRAYYQGQLKTTLAELRRPYEMLLQKVLALLQDGDPPLAGAIVASREAIWGILADPAKFATI